MTHKHLVPSQTSAERRLHKLVGTGRRLNASELLGQSRQDQEPLSSLVARPEPIRRDNLSELLGRRKEPRPRSLFELIREPSEQERGRTSQQANINLGGIDAGGRSLLPTIRPSTFERLQPSLDRGLIDRILEGKTTFTSTPEEARRIQDSIRSLPPDLQEEAIERFERGAPSPRLGLLGAVGQIGERLLRSGQSSAGAGLRGLSIIRERLPSPLAKVASIAVPPLEPLLSPLTEDTAVGRKLDEFATTFEQQEGGFFEKARKAELATDFPPGVKGALEIGLDVTNLIPVPIVDQLLAVGLRFGGRVAGQALTASLRPTRRLVAESLARLPVESLQNAGLKIGDMAPVVGGSVPPDFTTAAGIQKEIRNLKAARGLAQRSDISQDVLRALDDEIALLEDYRKAVIEGELPEASLEELKRLEELLPERQAALQISREEVRAHPAFPFVNRLVHRTGKNVGEIIPDAAIRERTGFGLDELAQELGYERGTVPSASGGPTTDFALSPVDRFRNDLKGLFNRNRALTEERREIGTLEDNLQDLLGGTRREAPERVGQVQAGMGIGEQPPQGELLGEFRGEAPEQTALIDRERILAQEARRGEIAGGQAEFALPSAEAEAARAARQPPTIQESSDALLISDVPLPESAAAGVPPITPTRPVEGGVTPPEPPTFPGIEDALAKAHAITEVDLTGVISNFVQKIPVVGGLRAFERPALGLNREIWDAWVARQAVNAQLKTEGSVGFSTFHPIFKDLDDAFGKRVVAGEKSAIKFRGTKEQEFPWVGTIKDIADRPKLYALTEAQERSIAAWNVRNTDSLRKVNAEFGTDIGEFVNPQGFASPNIDVSEAVQEAIENLGRSQRAILGSGRGRIRIFETAFDRWKADSKFVPETSLRKLTLAWDEFKINATSNRTFKEGIGGKTRVEVIEDLHPTLLVKKEILTRTVRNLRTRIQTALRQAQATDRLTKTGTTALQNVESKAQILTDRITALGEEFGPELSFLSGELQQVLAQARNLDKKVLTASTKFELTSARKTTLVKELDKAIDELTSISRSYEAANLGDVKLVQEGIFRYFPSAEAGQISQITKTSNNSFISFIDNIRRGVLTLDASPIVGVQAPMMWLFDPIGTLRQWIKGAGKAISTGDLTSPFNKTSLARDINSRPEQWADFAFYSGFPVGRIAPEEFGVGFWSKIPGIGPKIAQSNENMFNAVMCGMERMFREETQGLIKDGMDAAQAKATAIDMVTKAIPLLNPSRLGLPQARASAFRASVISVSFIRKPAELMMDAARGMFKAGTGQRLTPKDKIAMRMMGTMAASLSAISISSAVLSARERGQDELAAVKDVMDPTSGRFMSIIIGNRSIPLGGPFRGIVKAMVPREVEGIPFPVPLANVHNFFLNRLTPIAKTQLDVARNKDFFGTTIAKGNALEQMARILWYEVEGILPISLSVISEALRLRLDTGEVDIGDVAAEAAVQVGGANLLSETPFQFRDKQVIPWAKRLGLPDIESYYDLSPEFRLKFQKAEPEIFEEIQKETNRRAKRGDERSLRIVKSEELKQEFTTQQLADDEEFNAGRMESAEWRDRRRIRQATLNAKRDQIYQDLDAREPETPTDFYYAKIDELATKFNGIMTSEAWDELEQWVATLSPADQEFIEKNTRLGSFTPTVQQYFEANELLQPYWDIGEDYAISDPQTADFWRFYLKGASEKRRERMRDLPAIARLAKRRADDKLAVRAGVPAIDVALVRWYGFAPKTAQGRVTYKEVHGFEFQGGEGTRRGPSLSDLIGREQAPRRTLSEMLGREPQPVGAR